MTRTANSGKSRRLPGQKVAIKTKGQLESGRNAGHQYTGPLREWRNGAFLSSTQVENILDDRVSGNPPTSSLMHDDYDETSGLEFSAEKMALSTKDIALPIGQKDTTKSNDIASSSKVPVQADGYVVLADEEFEIWEDDIYESSMWDDDWEEIFSEGVHTRRSYSSVLQGKDG